MDKKNIIIVGLFPDAETAPVTQASELARVLKQNGYNVITVSKHRNKWLRLANIICALFLQVARYDVAIVQFYSGNSFIWQSIAARIVKALGKKLVFTIHGGGVPNAIKRAAQSYLSVLIKADVITVPSSFIKEALSLYHIPTTFIENSISLSRYPYHNKEAFKPVLLWMRSFGDIYDPLMAVEIVSILKPIYPDVKMYMGGIDMGLLQETKNRITTLHLDENIEIVGFMNFDKKLHYSGICDIYISTNKIDNAPVTIIEMWALGLPVVSTNVGGIPYLVTDGVDGLLAGERTAEAMAAPVRRLIEDAALSKKIAEAGRQRVHNYDEQAVFHKWDKLLTQL